MHVDAGRGTFERASSSHLIDVLRRARRHAPLCVLLALTIGVHWPSLHYYFLGDDFVPLSDIRTRTLPLYIRDVVLMRDSTPSWRPLTMLVYWGEFQLFGLNAIGWRIVSLAVHLAAVTMLYALVLSLTRRLSVALAAAMIFAVSPSAVATVTYVTAFPHVLGDLLSISSIYALVRYVQAGKKRSAWYWTSFVLFVAAFLANESDAVIGAVLLVYLASTSHRRGRSVRDVAVKMLPFALAAGLLAGGLLGCGCEAADGGLYSLGWHVARHTWVYMSRLAYPVGTIRTNPSAVEWGWGSAVIAFAIFFLARGPHVARLAAVGTVIGVMPFAPIKSFGGTAPRYTYLALPFFAILVAVAADVMVRHSLPARRLAATTITAIAIVTVGGLYSWQTINQTQPFVDMTKPWRTLADQLQRDRRNTPPATIYIVDDEGTWTGPSTGWGYRLQNLSIALYGTWVPVEALHSGDVERRVRNIPAQRIDRSMAGRLVVVFPPACGITTCRDNR